MFFDQVWKRLHPELSLKQEASGTETTRSNPRLKHDAHPKALKTPRGRNKSTQSVNSVCEASRSKVSNRTSNTQDSTKKQNAERDPKDDSPAKAGARASPFISPPIVHRGKASLPAARKEKAHLSTCMIPKKRYLYCQRHLKHCSDPSPARPPPPNKTTVPYSPSDVSVAMILANGFGKHADQEP